MTITKEKVTVTTQVGKVDAVGANIACIDIAEESDVKKTHHTILLLDCSGSMSGVIGNVRRDSQKFINSLPDGEFVSVLIFSGHGTAKLIAGPTESTENGRRLISRAIESHVKIISLTVFSEPLALALQTAQGLAGDNLLHNTVLFTDGVACPSRWNDNEERRKSLEEAANLKSFGSVLSAVGYGVYYDAKFLNDLVAANGGSGIYSHISEIEDFDASIRAIREVLEQTTPTKISLTIASDPTQVGLRIFKNTPDPSLISTNGKVELTGLYQGKVSLFVELPNSAKTVSITGTVNGQDFTYTGTPANLTPETATEFLRTLAVFAFTNGDVSKAAELLSETQDDGLADKVSSSFTNKEKRETGDIMRKIMRHRQFIGAGLKPTGPNHSILNVLRVLIEDPRNILYLPKNAYKRSGLAVKDPNVLDSPTGSTLKVLGYVSHVSRFNFSIKCLKDVKVLGEDGVATDRKVWRSYNLVLDGNLHISELLASLSKESFDMLQAAEIIAADVVFNPTEVYTLNLRSVKMVSPVWANPSKLGFVSLLEEEAELEAQQKALNARKKATKDDTTEPEEGEIYIEKAANVEGGVVEVYNAPNVEVRLMKFKPKAYDFGTLTYDEADAQVKVVRQRLNVVRFMIRAITFSMEVTGSKVIPWDTGATNRHGKLERFADYQGVQLKRVEWVDQVECS